MLPGLAEPRVRSASRPARSLDGLPRSPYGSRCGTWQGIHDTAVASLDRRLRALRCRANGCERGIPTPTRGYPAGRVRARITTDTMARRQIRDAIHGR